MTAPELIVFALSDSFSTLWAQIASELGLLLSVVSEVPRDVDIHRAVVLLAAGGEEHALTRASRELRAVSEVPFIAVGSAIDHRLAAGTIRAGADQIFELPADVPLLRSWLKEWAERITARQNGRAFSASEAAKYNFDGILGSSPSLAAAKERAARVIPHSGVTVLITGDTGTGKELFARAIHYNGPRREGPFVDINCAALPEHLLESDLFGHEKGAFTDASSAKPGLFEMAQGGTIFLDEIGHMALPLQGKLLRALQERSIRRVGGVRTIAIDVRVIAATHVNLKQAVATGHFREDLFYRLNVLPIELPALRERRDDILPLVRHYLSRFAAQYGVPVPSLTSRAERLLSSRDWLGNVRELRNVMERTVLLFNKSQLDAADFEADSTLDVEVPTDRPVLLADIVRDAVVRTLERCGGNKSEAARLLGISRPRLQRVLDGEGTTDGTGDASVDQRGEHA